MKVLIAPLNWGIGHATRSIPIITHHLNQGNEVHIASSGAALKFLKRRFPHLQSYSLPDYQIKYHKNLPVWLSIGVQIGRIYQCIKAEKKVVEKVCLSTPFNLILSDNRYGVYHEKITSQLICHQLSPIGPLALLQPVIEYIHRYLCKPFHGILIPDYLDNQKRLTGVLSKTNLKWKQPITYINPLSQLSLSEDNTHVSGRILVLLSGIEPKRSILEKLLITQLNGVENEVVIIGGTIEEKELPLPQFKYHSFLDKNELELEINKAEYIICRSGYSTIMDLHLLINKTILLIPTQGQTEQEYLAEYLSNKYKHFTTCNQANLNIKELIKNVSNNN